MEEERFNYSINDATRFVDELKDRVHELYDENHKLKEEIERLNNIINKLEKYINEEYAYDDIGMKIFDASKLQDKLQELKGSNDNG